MGVIEDTTERKAAEARIAHLANHDTLTDLPNRAAFNKKMALMLESGASAGSEFGVICVDLDRFKNINDVFGHSIGDMMLQQVAQRLQRTAGDAFVARLGGDEFTLLVNSGPQPHATAQLAERLLAAIADEFEIDGKKLKTALSIGAAVYPHDGTDARSLLGNADAALYRAKAEGRGSIRFFEFRMDEELRDRRTLQQDLRNAVERVEFVLHYQPIAKIDREFVGFEALVRWMHPTRGLISPAEFIPAAEESGAILKLGDWVLREACREAATWSRPLSISVNLSPAQFRHSDLPALVHSVLLETGLSAHRLILEITEGVLIDDFDYALVILRQLKGLGVKIAMDDFGIGYSSLSYLHTFPLDKIKIDQSFISGFARSPQSAAIIRTVIGLGRGLNLPVVAEGVETREQLDFLARENCAEVQGYFIGRPQPIDCYAEAVGRAKTDTALKRSA